MRITPGSRGSRAGTAPHSARTCGDGLCPGSVRHLRGRWQLPNAPGPPPGASPGSAISMTCSGSSRSAACSRHIAASSVRIGQTAASATAATWASHGSSPVLAITAASLTACSASRRGAIITASSRSRPCRMASVSSDRRSSDAATMARAGITRGCPEASSPWMNVMMP